MQRLILMRHGKAEAKSASGLDFDRALTPGGRADAAAMGAALAAEGLVPQVALVSGARRTVETWEQLKAAFPQARVQIMRGLYNASALAMFAAAEDVEAQCVLIVGHNPGVHELAVALLAQSDAGSAVVSRAASRFPPGSAAAFAYDEHDKVSYDGLFFPERGE